LKPNQKLSSAIVAILGSYAVVGHAQQQTSSAQSAGPSEAIAEIVVTAQRRSESIQNVPITIQAMTSETLNQLNVTTFDDVVKYMPNVALSTNGPAQGSIFMRGLALGAAGTQSSGTIGLYPNVAIYLDEQSGQFPERNLDVYAADIERIEVLEGPQGTLFGGGAEAGVLRYITNKPKLNKFEGSAEGMYGTTAHGDANSGFSAVLNLPLINDRLAVRAVFYNEERGGYINNVPSTFTRRNTDLGIYYAKFPAVAGACPDGLPNNGSCVPPGSPAINNYGIAKHGINPVKYEGTRVSALWQMSDDWSLLVQQSYQDMHSDGVFYQMPLSSEGKQLNAFEATLFNNSYNNDKFENTSWTLNGSLGILKAIYTGAYLTRDVEQVQDYTNYARGVYADYYQCYGKGSGTYSAAGNYAIYGAGDTTIANAHCNSPSATWRETVHNTHLTEELRFTTPDDWRLRFLFGGYWEQYRIYDDTGWGYKSLSNCTGTPAANGVYLGTGCMGNLGITPGVTANNPNTRNDSIGFFEDTNKGYKQYAVFASADVDLIPKVLTFTLGGRWYEYRIDQRGWVGTSFGCFEAAAPCYGYGTNMDKEHLNSEYKGTRWRSNVSWHVTPDAMLYYTFSQGYRPGGFNRKGGGALPLAVVDPTQPSGYSKGANQYQKPLAFGPDTLTNNEFGFKTQFFNHRLQLDGSIYKENWKNVQSALFNPGVLGNLTLAVNGADYEVKGAELQLTWRASEALSLIGSVSYNDAKQTDSPCLRDKSNNCITSYYSVVTKGPKQVINALGSPGTPTAYSPKVQGNLRARYDWQVDQYNWFGQVGVLYVGSMFNNVNTDPSVNGDDPSKIAYINTTLFRFKQDSYTTYDASFGVAKDAWSLTFFGQNLGNSDASTFTSTAQFVKTQVPLRPRVLGARVGLKF
jgi:iron complex outermembrane receptor protein